MINEDGKRVALKTDDALIPPHQLVDYPHSNVQKAAMSKEVKEARADLPKAQTAVGIVTTPPASKSTAKKGK